jgi:apolipoprotein N-acyltransferase
VNWAERTRAAATAARRHAGVCAFTLGAAQSLAFAPAALAPLAVLCLAGLWWLWRDAPPARAARLGFLFSAGLFLAGTYWLYTSIHVFGRAPLPIALLLMVGLAAIMGGYTAVLSAVLARVAPGARLAQLLALYPAGWVLMEWFRGWFLSGFPWLALGYSQIDTPLAGFAPLVGIYGVSLLTALIAGIGVAVVETRGRVRGLLVAVVVAALAGGGLLGRVEWTRPSGAALSVALVQGAISQDLKWQEENRARTLEVYRDLNRQALGARLIVWPEAALPALYHEVVPFLTPLYREAQAHGSDLAIGLLRYDFEAKVYRNGLVALGADEEWYYKRHLVPYGEFFPVPEFVREWMRLNDLAYSDLAPGAEDQPALDAAGQKLGATICYEDAYAVEQLDVLASATLLINVSNDAWFGDSSAPHQHLQIARFRALEAGRWMMRATNNGVSALIDPSGRVVARTRQFEPEVLRGSVVPHTGLTPYARLRNWPVLGVCLVLLLAALPFRRRPRG